MQDHFTTANFGKISDVKSIEVPPYSHANII